MSTAFAKSFVASLDLSPLERVTNVIVAISAST